MILMHFQKPAFYLRRDRDSGWNLAFWKWRIAFQMVARPRSQIRRTTAEIDDLRRVYNDTYAHWRREGVGGGDAERHAMRVLLTYLDGVETPAKEQGNG